MLVQRWDFRAITSSSFPQPMTNVKVISRQLYRRVQLGKSQSLVPDPFDVACEQ
jgi:hypothetical protein